MHCIGQTTNLNLLVILVVTENFKVGFTETAEKVAVNIHVADKSFNTSTAGRRLADGLTVIRTHSAVVITSARLVRPWKTTCAHNTARSTSNCQEDCSQRRLSLIEGTDLDLQAAYVLQQLGCGPRLRHQEIKSSKSL